MHCCTFYPYSRPLLLWCTARSPAVAFGGDALHHELTTEPHLCDEQMHNKNMYREVFDGPTCLVYSCTSFKFGNCACASETSRTPSSIRNETQKCCLSHTSSLLNIWSTDHTPNMTIAIYVSYLLAWTSLCSFRSDYMFASAVLVYARQL